MMRTKVLTGFPYVVTGILHFAVPKPYVAIMPPWIPKHKEMVAISGAAELAGGLALMKPGLEKPARWWMVSLLVAVFPANLHMALHPEDIKGLPDIPRWALWARLPLQLVFIWLVIRGTRTRPSLTTPVDGLA
jgi:uncharacterized membrane protein